MAQLPCIGSSWPLTKPPSPWCRYPWTCQWYSLPFCLRLRVPFVGASLLVEARRGFTAGPREWNDAERLLFTWWVVFCASEVYGWDMSTTHATLTPERDWETNVEKSWRTPKDLFWSDGHLGEKRGTLVKHETLAEPSWNLPWNLLAAQDRSNPENQRESESTPAPKPLLWLKTPKLLLLGKYMCIYVYICFHTLSTYIHVYIYIWTIDTSKWW